MSTVISQVRDEINKLVETCHDGEAGFRAAGEAISNPAIKAEMMQYSRQRAEFVTELEKAVAELGETPASEGSVAGALAAPTRPDGTATANAVTARTTTEAVRMRRGLTVHPSSRSAFHHMGGTPRGGSLTYAVTADPCCGRRRSRARPGIGSRPGTGGPRSPWETAARCCGDRSASTWT